MPGSATRGGGTRGSGSPRSGGGGNRGSNRSAVTRNTLRQQIADALRDEVVAGRLPAGRHVTVKEIAEQYGVSATPVREALVDLSAQGLVDLEHHRGFQVHRFTPDDFRGMVEARTLIVDAVFRRVAERVMNAATSAALTSVRRRADEAQRASRAGDLDILIGYDLRFWRELGTLIGNRYISDLLDRVRVQCWVFTVPYLRREPDLKGRLWCGHAELVDAVDHGDRRTTQRLLHAYDDHSLALLDELLARHEGPPGEPSCAEPPADERSPGERLVDVAPLRDTRQPRDARDPLALHDPRDVPRPGPR